MVLPDQQSTLPSGFFAAPPPPPPPPAPIAGSTEMAAIPYNYSHSQHIGPLFHGVRHVEQPTVPNASDQSRKRPRDEQFRCESCDISLDSNAALQAHLASHTTCSQCGYTAAPKLVKAHYESSHGRFAGGGFKSITVAVPGCPTQRFRICVGNHPDDVKEWIEERKRRFPRRQKAAEAVENIVAPPPKMAAVETSGVASLLAGYSSSDASDNDEAAQTIVCRANRDPALPPDEAEIFKDDLKPKRGVCRFFARNQTCRNGDHCAFSHEIGATSSQTNRKAPMVPKDRTKDTLLGKLLANDVRRERCLTIQLLEYLVHSDFLTKKP
ncbi:hypothetical protein MPSEU_001061600 [Mayamaea pseudoterrestris]|nr:hypothetical protein MPSEU_001061600 [Mayamaea pseudoterrestris]